MDSATLKPAPKAPESRPAEDAALTGLIPLVIGVSGHLDLAAADIPQLTKAVQSVFAEIRKNFPDRPLVLLTPLARGADCLVADVALANNARLVVPLPLERSEYEKDFSGAALKTFKRLIDDERVLRRITLPRTGSAAAGLDAPTKRELQYTLTGAYVARHADILIALWDGVESDKLGGTAQIVGYRQTGHFALAPELMESLADVPEPFAVSESLLYPPDTGPLYHIVTPRAKGPKPANAFTHRLVHAHADPAHHADKDIDERIRQFNSDARELEKNYAENIKASLSQLFPGSAHTQPAGESLPSGLNALRKSFALADALSIKHQRGLHRTLFVLFTMIFAAAIAFAVFAHGFVPDQPSSRATIAAYIGILALADAVFVWVTLRRWQDKHQDYRAVAEGLRVQFYWRLAGLQHAASDYYVHKQRDELSWIPHAVRACSVAAPIVEEDRLATVQSLWAEGQAHYYDTARARSQRSLRWRYAGSGSLVVSVLVAFYILSTQASSPLLQGVLIASIVVFLFHGAAWMLGFLGEHTPTNRAERIGNVSAAVAGMVGAGALTWLLLNVPHFLHDVAGWRTTHVPEWRLIALGICAVAGALLHGHSEIRAYAEHARHYGRMAAVFRTASSALRTLLQNRDDKRARVLVMELGKEALADHGDWVMLHRERPIELPEAGG